MVKGGLEIMTRSLQNADQVLHNSASRIGRVIDSIAAHGAARPELKRAPKDGR